MQQCVLITLLTWIAAGICSAGVVAYPAPAGLGTNTHGRASARYQVAVIQGGVTNSSFTYEIPADSTKPTRHNILSFTTFSHEGSVVVEVTQLAGTPITNASVHPTSYGIPVTIVAPNKVRFTVPGPMRKMAVIFNNDWVTHPLLVFADPLEVNPPAGPSANVLYYGPGVHNPGQIQINSGQTLYLAGGAYVKGWIEESGLNSVKILGRGILSAEDRPDTGAGLDTKTISLEGGNGNHVVDGITLIQSVGFTCTVRGNNNLIRNIKIIGCWHPTTDGVNTGHNSIVEDSFIKADDDTVKIYDDNMILRRLVIWQMENGGIFQHGWTGQNCTGAHVYDIDIIRTEWTTTDRDARGIIASVGMQGSGGNHLFEDIRVERGGGRLMSMNDRDATWANVTIRNLTVENWSPVQGQINGPKLHDIHFENFKLNGQFITSAAQANQAILNGAYNITFAVSGQDTHPPVVTITAPTNGSSFAFATPIPVSVTVTDDVSVAEVQLRVNGDWRASDTDVPYGFDVVNLTPGSYTLEVVGADSSFNTSTSSILVNVVAAPSGSHTNLDFIMSPFHWKPATNPAPPHPDAAINFGSATNVAWEWDNSSGDHATVTCEINRTTTGGPNGAEVYFFGGFSYRGTLDHLHLSADVSRSTIASQNIGNFHFALRQGTNLFHTSQGLNNVPSTAGPVVNYDLVGLTSMTLQTNGVNALTGLTWTPQYAGTGLDFTNGLPLEFGFFSSGSLGSNATVTVRGPQLDNFLVEIAGQVARPAPPALSLESGVGGQWRLHWDAAGFLLQEAPTVSGPWTNRVPQPSSPFPLSPTGVAGFYRLRWTGP